MIMSAAAQGQIQTLFAQLQSSRSTSSLCTTLQNTSVMLSGTTPKGKGFTGSGVILYSDTDTAYVVTAKHNLYVFNDQTDPPATWDPTVVTKFQQAIKINYDGPMAFGKAPGRSASISQVVTVDIPSPGTWTYDVMILKSADSDLMGFAKVNNLYPLDQADLNVVLNQQTYLQRNNTQNYFIQTGFGFVRDTASNAAKTKLPLNPTGSTNQNQTLQYRVTQPLAEQTNTVYNQFSTNKSQYYQFQNAFQVQADANNSTAPGDSGGPLFLLTGAGGSWALYLIGVTSGSDMALAQTPCPAPPNILENNIVTSLETCYRQNIF
jgi:hypothetical protein